MEARNRKQAVPFESAVDVGDVPVLTGAELVADRRTTTTLPIEFCGRDLLLEAHTFQGKDEQEQVLVLVHREATKTHAAIPIVRVHSGCVTGDIFHSLRCDCYQQLQSAIQIIAEAPLGAIAYVPYHEGRGIGLFKKMQAYALQDRGLDTVEANIEVGAPIDGRDYALAARALLALGMREVRLLSNNPVKEEELKTHGVEVIERLPLLTSPNKFNRRYLETKRSRMAHEL